MVTYPNRPGKPGGADRPGYGNNNRPGNNRPNLGGNDRPNRGNMGNNSGNNLGNNSGNKIDNSRDRNRYNNSKNVHIDNVNVNRRNNGLNRPSTLPARDRNWNSNKWGGNRGVWGNNNNIKINNNIQINNRYGNNFNYANRPNYWGARPWWGASNNHGWHHGHWNYGYNNNWYRGHYYYHDNSFAQGFMWGIAAWSLGNMVYDMGYQSYSNPYPAPPVQYNTYNTYNTDSGSTAASGGGSTATMSYQQPISVTAAEAPPGDEETAKLAATQSDEALKRSRNAFKNGDYVAALKADDEAIGYTPGDSTLHEYRALCLFALGKYGEAAGVLNPVLASGGHFLLGYHYLVSGHVDKAYEQFSKTVELQPADGVSRQLRDLMKDSLPDQGKAEEPEQEAPAPIPSEKLVGTWVSQPSSGGKITFTMEESGNFSWSFVDGDKTTELKGTYGLDDKGLLVLTTEDSQMVSSVALPDDSEMKFTLVGSPDGDPGLDFKKG